MTERSLNDLIARLSDRNGMAREQARHELVLMGAVAVPPLLGLLADSAKQTRWEAAKALAVIADPSSIPALVELLQDPEMDMRWIAAMGLVKIGPDSLGPVLRKLVDDPDSTDLRRSVHHVLYELARKRPKVREFLQPTTAALGEGSPASSIILNAEQALAQLESGRGIDRSDW